MPKNLTQLIPWKLLGRPEEDHPLYDAHKLQAADGRRPLRPQPQPDRGTRIGGSASQAERNRRLQDPATTSNH